MQFLLRVYKAAYKSALVQKLGMVNVSASNLVKK